MNFDAAWKKHTTLPSFAYAGIPYQSRGASAGALVLTSVWSFFAIARSGSLIFSICATTSASLPGLLARPFFSRAYSLIAARSSAVNVDFFFVVMSFGRTNDACYLTEGNNDRGVPYIYTMPRYEKVGKTKSQFVELLLDGRKVMYAEGERVGDGEWTHTHKFPTANLGGQDWYDKKIASLLAKKYVLVGDALQVVTPPPPKTPEQIETAKKIAEHMALLDTKGTVRWTGNTAETANQFAEVSVVEVPRGFDVIVRKGGIDTTKVDSDKDNYAKRDVALHAAPVRLHTLAKEGFGP